MLLKVIPFLLCFFSISLCSAQIITLDAVLLDEEGVAVQFATVHNESAKVGVVANIEGRFVLSCMPDDLIVIRSLGYSELRRVASDLQSDGIIVLRKTTYDLGDIIVTPNSVNANAIVRKFSSRIGRNYPSRPIIISGVYKEHSSNESEYYAYIQCDVDVFFNSMTSFFAPTIKTRVWDYRLFRHSNRKGVSGFVCHMHRLHKFWIAGHYFLSFRNPGKYSYTFAGHTAHNDSKLAIIKFYPKQIDRYVQQYEGVMYIDIETFGLIFFHSVMLPNEIDFSLNDVGLLERITDEETKIYFAPKDGIYYPSFTISKYSASVKRNDEEIINLDIVFNFFTKKVEATSRRGFDAGNLSLADLFARGERNIPIIDQSEDFRSDFVIETEEERLFFNYNMMK